MDEHAERILQAAMELPADDREVIGVTLLASLTKEDGYDEAWEEELDRRIEELESGKVEGKSLAEIRKVLREKSDVPSRRSN